MKSRTRHVRVLLLAIAVAIAVPAAASAAAPAPVDLGACASYGVFSQHVINNSGTTNVIGDLGVPPGGHAIPPGLVVTGQITTQSAAPLTAMQAAFADAISRSWDATITSDLGGQTLLPGVYRDEFARQTTIDINGTLTLDAQGDPNAVWIFQSPYDLRFGQGSRIVLINGARFCRVFFAVRNAYLGAGSAFQGHILAAGVITADQGATVRGQLLSIGDRAVAADGSVTLNNNAIDNSAYVCPTYTPRLPKTGYPPQRSGLPWQIPVGLLVASAIALPVVRRRALSSR